MASFNPYHKWLAIPPEEQPPNHYRLLGLPVFEVDAEVIEGAAERQTIYLRTFQTGDNAELAEQLLNEVSEARICLLNEENKAEYDKRLQVGAEHSRLKGVATATPERVIPRQEKTRPLANEDEVAVPVEPVAAEDPSTQERDWTFATVKLPDDQDRRLVEPEQLDPLDTDPLAGFPADLAPHAGNVNDLKRVLGTRRKTFWQEPWAVPAAAGGVVGVVLLLMLATSWIGRIGDAQNDMVTSQQNEDQQAIAAAETFREEKLAAEKAAAEKAAAEKRAAEVAREDEAAAEREAAFLAVAMRRGNGYLENEEFDKAIADYTEAININPNHATAYANRGIAYHENKEYDMAITDCNEAIRLDPNDAAGYVNRGASYYGKKEYDKAIADCNEAIRLDPNLAKAYFYRGVAYGGKKELDRTIFDCNEAIRLDPNYAKAYRKRGFSYCQKKEYDKAIVDFSEAIRINPDYALAYNNRAMVHYELGDADKAIADYTEALRLNPNDSVSYVKRALAVGYASRKNNNALRKKNNEKRDLARTHSVQGGKYLKEKKYDLAIEQYNEAIRIDPDDTRTHRSLAIAHNNRAVTYSRMKQYDRALAHYTEAIRINPDYANAYHNLGAMYSNMGFKVQAKAAYVKARELGYKPK